MAAAESRWLLSGYSGAGADLLLASLAPDGTLAAGAALRSGENPSCLCAGARPGAFYAGCELPHGAAVLRLHAGAGGLALLARYPAPGAGLCHVLHTPAGVFGCCYGSGDVFLMAGDGRIVWRARPPQARHAHWGALTPDGRAFAWADLGADSVFFVPLRAGVPCGRPVQTALPTGSGPRQVLFLREGLAAVVLERGNGVALLCKGPGGWRAGPASPCTGAQGQNYPGGACLGPDGTLFVANRGADTVAALRAEGGALRLLGEWPAGGRWPRWTACRGGVVLAACQHSGRVCSYLWQSGRLRPAGALALEGASCAVQG